MTPPRRLGLESRSQAKRTPSARVVALAVGVLVFDALTLMPPGRLWAQAGGTAEDVPRGDSVAGRGEPVSAEALFERASATTDCGDAEETYVGLVEQYPEHPLADDALFAAGMLQYSLGYHRTAVRTFQRVLQDYPEGDRALEAGYWQGVARLASGHPDEALERFLWVIDRDPSTEKGTWARIGAADCFRQKGQWPEAAQAYEEVLERFPSADLESAALFHLAEAYEALGRGERAWGLWVRLAESYPETPEGTQAVARLGDRPEPDARPSRPDSTAEGVEVHEPEGARDRETWAVQVGAFGVPENAGRLARVLQARGYRDVRVEADGSPPDAIHRVLVGRFSSEESAREMATILREHDHLEAHILRQTTQRSPTP